MQNQQINDERKALILVIRRHLRRGDLGLIALKSGFTKQYVRKILSPNFNCFNIDVIDAALALSNQRQKEEAERMQMAEVL